MAGSGTAHLRSDTLLRVEDLVVEYRVGRQTVHAVSGVSFDIRRGETLGLVGESGCGKSSAGRAVLMLRRPGAGRVVFDGHELTAMKPRALRRLRRRLQVVFQDPRSSLNGRRSVRKLVSEGLAITRAPKPWRPRVDEVLHAVGLDPEVFGARKPGELSGGQAQRVAIARALVLEPDLVVCDEPVSALDVSIQAQILNLLADMKERYALTLLFVAHDLAVVKNVSDRVAVMYLGKLCEVASSERLYAEPRHPYTRALLSAAPEPDPDAPRPPMQAIGDLPSPLDPPSGCRFRTRCPRAGDVCAAEEPILRPMGDDHFVACHFPVVEPFPLHPQPQEQQ